MRIKDIRISEVREGKNWRLLPPVHGVWSDLTVEEWGDVEEVDHFSEKDTVI
jgi:hypothetical protein